MVSSGLITISKLDFNCFPPFLYLRFIYSSLCLCFSLIAKRGLGNGLEKSVNCFLRTGLLLKKKVLCFFSKSLYYIRGLLSYFLITRGAIGVHES